MPNVAGCYLLDVTCWTLPVGCLQQPGADSEDLLSPRLSNHPIKIQIFPSVLPAMARCGPPTLHTFLGHRPPFFGNMLPVLDKDPTVY